jgi:hypothetical protein
MRLTQALPPWKPPRNPTRKCRATTARRVKAPVGSRATPVSEERYKTASPGPPLLVRRVAITQATSMSRREGCGRSNLPANIKHPMEKHPNFPERTEHPKKTAFLLKDAAESVFAKVQHMEPAVAHFKRSIGKKMSARKPGAKAQSTSAHKLGKVAYNGIYVGSSRYSFSHPIA